MNEVVNANCANFKTGVKLSNSAKLLDAYMRASGVTEAKAISQALDIPVRTIQRLKLEIACATDGAPFEYGESANSAKHATDGAANSATGGVSSREVSNINNNKTNYLETPVASQQASVEQEAARGLASSNPDFELIKFVEDSMHNGDERSAREWLNTTAKTYGGRVVREAYTTLKTDMAEGALISKPLKTLCAIAKRISEQGPQPSRQPQKSFADQRRESVKQRFAQLGIGSEVAQ